jgi:hypothetical protein
MQSKYLCRYNSILVEIKERFRLFNSVIFIHERREVNQEAHLIARNAISGLFGCRVWYFDPPDFVPLVAQFE